MSILNSCVDIPVNGNSRVRIHLQAPPSIPQLLKVLDMVAYIGASHAFWIVPRFVKWTDFLCFKYFV